MDSRIIMDNKMNKLEYQDFINNLLAFLEIGFQNPINIINYLNSRDKCNKLICKTKDCEVLSKLFTENKNESPWCSKVLSKFDELRRQWYNPEVNSWEEPLNAFFTLPRIAQFLEEEMKLSSEEIIEVFKMEFKGGGEKENSVPKCLWKGNKQEWTAITKKFNDKKMCCDFYLKMYNINEISIPNLVGEIKIAVPQQKKQYLE